MRKLPTLLLLIALLCSTLLASVEAGCTLPLFQPAAQPTLSFGGTHRSSFEGFHNETITLSLDYFKKFIPSLQFQYSFFYPTFAEGQTQFSLLRHQIATSLSLKFKNLIYFSVEPTLALEQGPNLTFFETSYLSTLSFKFERLLLKNTMSLFPPTPFYEADLRTSFIAGVYLSQNFLPFAELQFTSAPYQPFAPTALALGAEWQVIKPILLKAGVGFNHKMIPFFQAAASYRHKESFQFSLELSKNTLNIYELEVSLEKKFPISFKNETVIIVTNYVPQNSVTTNFLEKVIVKNIIEKPPLPEGTEKNLAIAPLYNGTEKPNYDYLSSIFPKVIEQTIGSKCKLIKAEEVEKTISFYRTTGDTNVSPTLGQALTTVNGVGWLILPRLVSIDNKLILELYLHDLLNEKVQKASLQKVEINKSELSIYANTLLGALTLPQ